GLASDPKRVDPLMIKKKLVQADRKLLIDHLSSMRDHHAKAFMDAVEKTSDKLTETITAAKAARERYLAMLEKADSREAKELRKRCEQHLEEFRRDLKTWRRLCRLVLKMEPAV